MGRWVVAGLSLRTETRQSHVILYSTLPSFVTLCPTVRAYVKMDPRVRLSMSLKVIGADTDRSATYDFLLVIHSNDCPLSYRLRVIGDFG